MTRSSRRKGFTLLELMAVILIIMIVVGISGLTFMNSRDSVKFRRDANQCLTFIRTMWDFTKTSNSPLILLQDSENGSMAFIDPRTGVEEKLKFPSGGKVLGVLVNDRFYPLTERAALQEPEEEVDPTQDGPVYISEGRGLSKLGIILVLPKDQELDEENPLESYQRSFLVTMNLITGKGKVKDMEPEQIYSLLQEYEERL